MKRVLLLNPPASPPVMRDYYCGHVAKGRYCWPPVDLLALSGSLAQRFDVSVLDAIAENLTEREALNRLSQLRPDAVISLAAAISWTPDMRFLAEAHGRTGVPILLSGGLSAR